MSESDISLLSGSIQVTGEFCDNPLIVHTKVWSVAVVTALSSSATAGNRLELSLSFLDDCRVWDQEICNKEENETKPEKLTKDI